MLQKTRCKFYVSSRNVSSSQPFENQPTYESAVVNLNAAYSPDSSTENYSFWQATPNGSATLYLNKEDGFDLYNPGSFWYLDIGEDAEGEWIIEKIEKYDTNINVELLNKKYNMWGGDKIKLGITNKNAWNIFEEGKKYQVDFSPTVKS